MSMRRMGLGLTTNLHPSVPPDPWALAAERPGLVDFVEYSAPLSLEEARRQAALFARVESGVLPVLFHPVHLNLDGPELEPVEHLRALDEHARAVRSPWVGNDVGWCHGRGTPFPGYQFISPSLNAASVERCAAHALHVQVHLSVPLLLENPVVNTARGNLHVLDFMGALHARTGCGLILDLGHLFSHQLARGLPLEAGLDGFPLGQVREVHLAGGVLTRAGHRASYFDDHTQPLREELFGLLESLVPRLTGLQAVTLELDGHPDAQALRTLERIRPLVPAASAGDMPDAPRAPAVPTAVDPGPAWATYDRTWGRDAEPEDPEGAAAELDIRLSALAEVLDGPFPLSRVLLAGTRDRLAAFAASDAFRDCFEQGRPLSQGWGRWSRAQVRAAPGPGVELALAFEAWAHGAARKQGPQVFPLDLSEAFFALRGLRRHLGARAWATGTLPEAAAEALRQVLERPARGPWRVEVGFDGERLELRSPSRGPASP
ncbi:MAG: hypothetical protein RL653_281 [Pseudomonadota bacterium]